MRRTYLGKGQEEQLFVGVVEAGESLDISFLGGFGLEEGMISCL